PLLCRPSDGASALSSLSCRWFELSARSSLGAARFVRRGLSIRARRAFSPRIRVDQTAQPAAIEMGPSALGLCQSVGNDVDGGGVVSEAAMARPHFDALRVGALILDAGLPCDDAVAAAEDRSRWHRRRNVQFQAAAGVFNRMSGEELVESPGMGCLRVLERASQGDDHADVAWRVFGDLSREHAAEAPADEAYLAAVVPADVSQALQLTLGQPVPHAEIAAQLPTVRCVAPVAQKGAQGCR